jgi:uncharacterized protein YyaL (SSP411 family)
LSTGKQIAIVYGKEQEQVPLLTLIRSEYRPNIVVAATKYPPSEEAPALLNDRPLKDGKATAYLCEHFVCKQPVNTPEDLLQQL